MTTTTTPQLALTRVFNAPRAILYQEFTDPDHLATWWGPIGNSLPRDEMDFDVRPGGHQRWTEVFPADPGIRVHVHLDLAEVVDGELLDGGITRWASACGGSASELGRAQCSSQPRPPRPVGGLGCPTASGRGQGRSHGAPIAVRTAPRVHAAVR